MIFFFLLYVIKDIITYRRGVVVGLSGVVEGVAGNAIWNSVMNAWQWLTGSHIEITEPQPQAILKDPKPLPNGGQSYRAKGRIKRLPKGHKIWLLIEHDGVPDKIWPQSFSSVQYNPANGEWEGRVNPSNKDCTVHAVVAPPTSNDFFEYYRKANEDRERWVPLIRIPAECTNRTAVQAYKP
jgi:hypothetical protein